MIMPRCFFIALVKLCRALCWSLLYGWRTWDANGLQMVVSWSQNIDMLEKAPNVASRGLFYCYGIFISFTRKVASRVKSDGLKAMLWCRVVAWEIVNVGRVVLVLVSWAGSLGLWMV